MAFLTERSQYPIGGRANVVVPHWLDTTLHPSDMGPPLRKIWYAADKGIVAGIVQPGGRTLASCAVVKEQASVRSPDNMGPSLREVGDAADEGIVFISTFSPAASAIVTCISARI
jgi:hypothetical protein